MSLVYFWGQPVEVKGREWHTTIKKTFIQKGQHIRVGLNEKLIGECAKENGVLVVTLADKGVTFRMSAAKWLKTAKIHNEPSVKKPGTTFIIYQVEVPMSAFKELINPKKPKEISKDQLGFI